MGKRVTFTVVEGEPVGREFVFSSRTIGAIGRSGDCLIRFPNDEPHQNVSRHHCLLDIDPLGVRVRDLGSRNGTYLNGEMIGQRPHQISAPEDCAGLYFPSCRLQEGDEIRLGDTVLRMTTAAGDDDTAVGVEEDEEAAAAVYG
jgi:pSer/pThr/pTyr-binding forkhead associated (FHA) protein